MGCRIVWSAACGRAFFKPLTLRLATSAGRIRRRRPYKAFSDFFIWSIRPILPSIYILREKFLAKTERK